MLDQFHLSLHLCYVYQLGKVDQYVTHHLYSCQLQTAFHHQQMCMTGWQKQAEAAPLQILLVVTSGLDNMTKIKAQVLVTLFQ